MAIYQLTDKSLKPIAETSFGAEGIMERKDLQRLLRDQIDVLGERLMVIAEEFGGWADSSRRIDLLCMDADANLVVVELKRTEDGGHMELQALRYAAMIARMTFEQLVDACAKFRGVDTATAKGAIQAFVDESVGDTEEFAPDTRIVLVAADFSKELTTCVMWLIDQFGVDIRCMRMKPYKMDGGTVLLDVEQIIPLPEASQYQTQIGAKTKAEQEHAATRHGLRRSFWEELLAHPRSKDTPHANRKPTKDGWLSGGIGRAGFSLTYSIRKNDSQVELYIAFGAGQVIKNKAAFKALEAHKKEIETDFGAPLEWQELPEGDGCRIRYVMDGGYRSPRDRWPDIHSALTDAMIRLDKAMRPRVASLTF